LPIVLTPALSVSPDAGVPSITIAGAASCSVAGAAASKQEREFSVSHSNRAGGAAAIGDLSS
jgi:hypothetical protein